MGKRSFIKEKSKSLSSGQTGSPQGPLKKKKKSKKKTSEKINCKLIANRQDKKKIKEAFKEAVISAYLMGIIRHKPKLQSALTREFIICSPPIIVTFVSAPFSHSVRGRLQKGRKSE